MRAVLQRGATGGRTSRTFAAVRCGDGACAARGDAMSAVGLHAFNLLPYRPGARRRARNPAVALLAGASLAGCAAVGAMASWDALERVRIDEKRDVLDAALRQLSAPVAEHARLLEAEALRQRAQSAAAPIAEPRARFLGLLDALARGTSQGNIALQRVTQRVNEV